MGPLVETTPSFNQWISDEPDSLLNTYPHLFCFSVSSSVLNMSDETVTKDFVFYVADILIDELAQNAAVASDTKRRVRFLK